MTIEKQHINDKKTFFNAQSFALIKQAQQCVQQETEMFPSIRKVINSLITDESIQTVIQQLIAELTPKEEMKLKTND